jgi:glutamate dehydrogenase
LIWCVRNVDFKDGLEAVVARFGQAIRQIVAGLDTTLPTDLQPARAKRRQDLTDAGVTAGRAGSANLNRSISGVSA